MDQHRRGFLATAAALSLSQQKAASAEALPEWRSGNRDCYGLKQEILDLFSDLPDRKAFKIWTPATKTGPEFLVQMNEQKRMFTASTNKSFVLCERLRQLDSRNIEERLVGHERKRMFTASTNKAFILCERLRQLDSRNIEERLAGHELRLDESVWSPGSTIFNPPDLSGWVSERTAMEAMMVHSDNTGTDMVLKEAGAQQVRKFITAIGLKSTAIPDSTRIFAGYLVGAPNYMTITWDELISYPAGPLAHPLLNDVETLASSSDDLVSFFSRALKGKFFSHLETLEQFRRILALGDINYLVRFPLGMSVFGKAGYADALGIHARSIAGAVYFRDRWVYFSMILNWDAAEANDSQTVEKFYSAIRRSMALLQEKLGD